MARRQYCDICKKEAKCRVLFFGNHVGFSGNPKAAKQILIQDVCKKCFDKLIKKFTFILREFSDE